MGCKGMNYIAHRNYVGGPLNGQPIALIDWPENKKWLITAGHLYSRRTRRRQSSDSALSAIYYLDEVTIAAPGPRESLSPYPARDINNEERFQDLLQNMKHYVQLHHNSFIVIVKLELELPGFTLTQAFHASTSREHIHDFLNFAKTIQFDANHDDACCADA